MTMKWFFSLIKFIGIVMIVLLMNQSLSAHAESVSSVETEGSIGFYGIYQSEIEPQPVPPSGPESIYPDGNSQKASQGKLPRTGIMESLSWFWLGILVVLLVLVGRNRYYSRQKKVAMNYQ